MPSSPTRVPTVYRWLSSLRSQLVLMLLLASLAPVLAVVFLPGVGLYDQSRSSLEEAVGVHLHEVADELLGRATEPAQARLDNVVGLARDVVQPHLAEMMRHDPTDLYRSWKFSGQSLDAGRMASLRRALTDRAPRMVHYVIADARGILLMSSDLHAPFDVSEEPWWKETVESRRNYIGKTAYDDASDSVILTISVQVREGSTPLGAIKAVFAMPELGRLTRISSSGGIDRERDIVIMGLDGRDGAVYMVASSASDWRDLRDGDRVYMEVDGHPEWNTSVTVALDHIDLPTGSSVSVTDRTVSELEGEIAAQLAREGNLASPPITRLGVKKAQLLYSRAAEEATRRNSSQRRRLYSVEKDGYGAERVYGMARPAGTLPWSVVVSEPTRLAFTSAQALRQRVLWFVGAAIAALGVTSVVFASRLMRPLSQITDAAQSIRRGDYQQAIPITMHNEIGILVEEFNEMTGTVQEALGSLTREEKKLSSVLNSVAEGIVYLDLDRKIVLTNPAAEHLLGLPDDAAGKVVDELLDPAVVVELFSRERVARRRAQPVSTEVSLTVGDETRALKVVSSAVTAGDDASIGTVYVLDDITREKEIEQMKSDFVALVSHELRTPLTSIYGYTRLILDGKTGDVPELTLDKLVRVERQALRLSHLISDLLDLSRIESGRMEMRMAPTSIVEVAATRMDDIRTQADDKDITLSLEAADDVPDAVADGERIGQVVTNLLSNAVKFTPQGGSVRVRIGQEGEQLSIQVIDTGTGIPPEERSLIFDKFHQVSNVHTRQQGGTGLGLAIAKSIVEAHGGRIWVDDGAGSGSDFRFVLPLADTKGAVLTHA